MLGKNKNWENGAIPTPSPDSTGKKTIIGEHISIEGSIKGNEDLIIDGSVTGSVELEDHHLTVGPAGQMEGEITAANVTISGRLVGNIKAAGKVEITKEADFNGELKAKRISVEDGAFLKAVIELEPEPQKKSVSVALTDAKTPDKTEKEPLTLIGNPEKRK